MLTDPQRPGGCFSRCWRRRSTTPALQRTSEFGGHRNAHLPEREIGVGRGRCGSGSPGERGAPRGVSGWLPRPDRGELPAALEEPGVAVGRLSLEEVDSGDFGPIVQAVVGQPAGLHRHERPRAAAGGRKTRRMPGNAQVIWSGNTVLPGPAAGNRRRPSGGLPKPKGIARTASASVPGRRHGDRGRPRRRPHRAGRTLFRNLRRPLAARGDG